MWKLPTKNAFISCCIFVILMSKTKAAVSKSSIQVWSWETLGIKSPPSGHREEEEGGLEPWSCRNGAVGNGSGAGNWGAGGFCPLLQPPRCQHLSKGHTWSWGMETWARHLPAPSANPRISLPAERHKDKPALNKRWAELCKAAFISLLEM